MIHTALLVLGGLTFGFTLIVALDFVRGIYKLARLSEVEVPPGATLPRLTVIVPARNEERHLEEAVGSMLAQDYEDLEVIVIDDRSTDRTAEVLARLAARNPRLRVAGVSELPPGWLGKNHANQLGAHLASSELLLFTDADIVMQPGALRRAAFYLQDRRLDHLTATPSILMPGLILNMFGMTFGVLFFVFMRPWRACDPRSRHYVGIGAFNMVRRSAYQAAGTHQAIALRPDDDIKLGKLLKRHGARQELILASDLLSVEWYASLREVVVGLEKNTFAGLDYSLRALALSSFLQVACGVWPFAALVVTEGWTWLANLGVVLLTAVMYWPVSKARGNRWWYFLSVPLTASLFVFISWRAVLITLRQGGIRWRETLYPLEQLKANRV